MRVLVGNGPWMVWNTMLAVVPLGLGLLLFFPVQRSTRSVFWWIGFVAFVAFLPNAPYVITDLIHLRGDALEIRSSDAHSLLLYAEYAVFVIVGVACYVGALELLRRFLRAREWSRSSTLCVELSLHALCAVGVLLGRVARFNSWDLGTRPGEVFDHALSRLDRYGSWVLLILTFVMLVVSTFAVRLTAVAILRLSQSFGSGPRALS